MKKAENRGLLQKFKKARKEQDQSAEESKNATEKPIVINKEDIQYSKRNFTPAPALAPAPLTPERQPRTS